MSIETLLGTHPLTRLIAGLAGIPAAPPVAPLPRETAPSPAPSLSILDLEPSAFVFALDELGLAQPERERLQTEYRRARSPLAPAMAAIPQTPEGMRRGMLLPAVWPEGQRFSGLSGNAELAWPGLAVQLARDVLDAADIPAATLRGVPVSEAERANAALTVADLGLGLGTGTAARGALFAAPGSAASDPAALSIFGSYGAQGAPKAALRRAQEAAEAEGRMTDELLQRIHETRQPDDPRMLILPHEQGIAAPLFEIPRNPDTPLPLRYGEDTLLRLESGNPPARLDELIDWPELFEAYPDLRSLMVSGNRRLENTGTTGQLVIPNGAPPRIEIEPWALALQPDAQSAVRDLLGHEVQHAVAALDPTVPQGTNPRGFLRAGVSGVLDLVDRRLAAETLLAAERRLGALSPQARELLVPWLDRARDALETVARMQQLPEAQTSGPAALAMYRTSAGEALANLSGLMATQAPRTWLDVAPGKLLEGVPELTGGGPMSPVNRIHNLRGEEALPSFEPGVAEQLLAMSTGFDPAAVTGGLMDNPQRAVRQAQALPDLAEAIGARLARGELTPRAAERLLASRSVQAAEGASPDAMPLPDWLAEAGLTPRGTISSADEVVASSARLPPETPRPRATKVEPTPAPKASMPVNAPSMPEGLARINSEVPDPPDWNPRSRTAGAQPTLAVNEAEQLLRKRIWNAIKDKTLTPQQLADLPDTALSTMPPWRANLWTRAREWANTQPGVTAPSYVRGRSRRAAQVDERGQPVTAEMRERRRAMETQQDIDEMTRRWNKGQDAPDRAPRTRAPTDPVVPEQFRVTTEPTRTTRDNATVRERRRETVEFIEAMTKPGPNGEPPRMTREEAVRAAARRQNTPGRSVADEPLPESLPQGPGNRRARAARARQADTPAPTAAERFYGQRRASEMRAAGTSRRPQGNPDDGVPQGYGPVTPPRVVDPGNAARAPRERNFQRAPAPPRSDAPSTPAPGSAAARFALDDRLKAQGPLFEKYEPGRSAGRAEDRGRGKPGASGTRNIADDSAQDIFYAVPRDIYEEVMQGELPGQGSRTFALDDTFMVPRKEMAAFNRAYNALAAERGWQKARTTERANQMTDAMRRGLSGSGLSGRAAPAPSVSRPADRSPEARARVAAETAVRRAENSQLWRGLKERVRNMGKPEDEK